MAASGATIPILAARTPYRGTIAQKYCPKKYAAKNGHSKNCHPLGQYPEQ
ncbi:hypothetical protein Pla52n_32450 [Stieleria varia]|uniref:Uncharacterized protein n=1 Tax=Stieleria varia TaxID=2528005 RepID=A0A5C6ASZ8_9BACT|nr:hypothetical protein Pla52n_32450 [Stieleria varia]